jgi:hypothetical protein
MSISSTPWLEMISNAGTDFELDHAVVEAAFPQLLAELLAGAHAGVAPVAAEPRTRRGGSSRQQQVQQALFGIGLGLLTYFFELFLAYHVDGDLDEIAHHGFHVAADIADLREL